MAVYKTEIIIGRSYPTPGNYVINNLNTITILLGRNGSGKSQMLRNLANNDKQHFHYVSPERGGDYSWEPQYISEQANSDQRYQRRISQNFAPTFRQEVVARISTLLTKMGEATRNGLPSIKPQDIEEMVSILVPEWSFKITSGTPPYEIRRIIVLPDQTRDEGIGGVGSLSSGEAAMLDMALDIVTMCGIWELDETQERFLLIDEPDLHLHYDLQQKLAEFIAVITRKFDLQTIVATHSTTFMAALGLFGADEEVSVVYLDPSKPTSQTATPFKQSLKDTSALLGGHALMGPLFGYPILLVEGDDDYKVWSLAARHHVIKVSVLPTEGSKIAEYTDSLEKIFAATLDADPSKYSAFALYDNDDLSEEEMSSAHVYVKKIRLNCREVENLYLSDEVLKDIGIQSWEIAKTMINEKISNFGKRKQLLLEKVINEDRRAVDLKGVIDILVEILDVSKRLDWRVRLSRVIGSKKPEGQLAEFLGNQVVSSLWID